MAPLNVAVYGAGWIHNMGNSFIQLGSKASIERASPGSIVQIVEGNPFPPPTSLSERACSYLGSRLHIDALKQPLKNQMKRAWNVQVKLSALADVDVVVVSGVWLSTKYLEVNKADFLSLKERGIPLILNGGGGTFYDEQEVKQVSQLLKELQPFALISRDQQSYENYRNVVQRSFPGIDAGFFIADAVPKPLPLKEKKIVYCFDRSPVPASLPFGKDAIIVHHSTNGLRHNPFQHPTFYGEIAEDYLSLYAHSKTTYSDRVHACVATLAFGNPARLIDETPRARLFDMLDAGKIREKIVILQKDVLERRKQEHLEALRSVFRDLEHTVRSDI